jgi:hypothetical protein
LRNLLLLDICGAKHRLKTEIDCSRCIGAAAYREREREKERERTDMHCKGLACTRSFKWV